MSDEFDESSLFLGDDAPDADAGSETDQPEMGADNSEPTMGDEIDEATQGNEAPDYQAMLAERDQQFEALKTEFDNYRAEVSSKLDQFMQQQAQQPAQQQQGQQPTGERYINERLKGLEKDKLQEYLDTHNAFHDTLLKDPNSPIGQAFTQLTGQVNEMRSFIQQQQWSQQFQNEIATLRQQYGSEVDDTAMKEMAKLARENSQKGLSTRIQDLWIQVRHNRLDAQQRKAEQSRLNAIKRKEQAQQKAASPDASRKNNNTKAMAAAATSDEMLDFVIKS